MMGRPRSSIRGETKEIVFNGRQSKPGDNGMVEGSREG